MAMSVDKSFGHSFLSAGMSRLDEQQTLLGGRIGGALGGGGSSTLFLDVDFPVTLMTTRAFVATVTRWGINQDAVLALESIAGRYDLKPALVGEIDPSQPPDLRVLPQPMPPDAE